MAGTGGETTCFTSMTSMEIGDFQQHVAEHIFWRPAQNQTASFILHDPFRWYHAYLNSISRTLSSGK